MLEKKDFLLLLVIIVCCIGCSEKEHYLEEDISDLIKTTGTFECENPILNINLNSNEEFVIIENEDDLQVHVSIECSSNVNFNEYNLIIGHYFSQKKIISFNYKLYKSTDQEYKLYITPTYSEETEDYNEDLIHYYFYFQIPKTEKINNFLIIKEFS